MRIKSFSFFICLTLSLAGFSNVAYSTNHPADLSEKELPPCNFLAPTNFHATEIGTNFVQLSWVQPGAPPPFYNIKAIQVSNGAIVANFNFPNNTNSITVDGLQSGTLYNFVLTPTCLGESLGNNFAITPAETLILDLVVSSFTPTSNPGADAHLYANGDYYTFPKTGTPRFKICPKNVYNQGREFRIQKDDNYNALLNGPNSSDNYKFYSDSGCDPNPSCPANGITIKLNGNVIASFTMIEPTANGKDVKISCTSMNTDYEIAHLTGYEFAPPESDVSARDNYGFEQNAIAAALSASPNPFTNVLDIQIPYAKEGNDMDISLYDLRGRLVISEKTPGGAQIRSLSTQDLVPGLYLLRVDTGDKSETIKVVKTQ